MRLLIADSDPLILKSLEICFTLQTDFVVMEFNRWTLYYWIFVLMVSQLLGR